MQIIATYPVPTSSKVLPSLGQSARECEQDRKRSINFILKRTFVAVEKKKIIVYFVFVSVAVACMGEERGVYRVLVGKLEGRRPLGRPRRRWVDNIRMDLQEVGCGYVDWIGLAQDTDRWRKLVSAVMNLRVS